MNYLVLRFNERDKQWMFYGLRGSHDEAEKLAAQVDWPDSPIPLAFTPRPEPVLEGVLSAWSGHDQYFIIPVEDHSGE